MFKAGFDIGENLERTFGGLFAEIYPVKIACNLFCAGFFHKADILFAFRMVGAVFKKLDFEGIFAGFARFERIAENRIVNKGKPFAAISLSHFSSRSASQAPKNLRMTFLIVRFPP